MTTKAMEAAPADTYHIRTINLPDGKRLHNYYFGPENLVSEEVVILITKNGLDGGANNYAVKLNNAQGSTFLDHGKTVEFYNNHFKLTKITVDLIDQRPAEPQTPNLDNLAVRRTQLDHE